MGKLLWLAVYQMMIVLHGVDGHEIYVNSAGIVLLRDGKADDGSGKIFVKGARCLINTSDGKFITVVESCEAIRLLIQKEGP